MQEERIPKDTQSCPVCHKNAFLATMFTNYGLVSGFYVTCRTFGSKHKETPILATVPAAINYWDKLCKDYSSQ